MTNAFASLPNEIINDVIIVAGAQRDSDSQARIHHQFLVHCDGPWGDFARIAAPIVFTSSKLVLRNHGSEDRELTFEEAENRPISHCQIDGSVDMELLRKVAPRTYDSFKLFSSSALPADVLDLFGNRFTQIKWTVLFGSLSTSTAEFLKRQLRSKYLRKIYIIYSWESLEISDFEDSFVEFVKKPTFERLVFLENSFLSPRLFLEADRAWRARSSFEARSQKIHGLLTRESLEEVIQELQITLAQPSLHPQVTSASRTVTSVKDVAETFIVSMEFVNWLKNEDDDEDDEDYLSD